MSAPSAALVLNGQRLAGGGGVRRRPRGRAVPPPPRHAVVRVGQDEASGIYVKRKAERAEKLGFHQESIHLPDETTQAELLALIDRLNDDPLIDGILVQLPLPAHLDPRPVLDRIDPGKDVDGFHPENVGLLSQGRPRFVPCTPAGVMHLIGLTDLPLAGARAVVLGRSNIVGRPMAMLLEQAHATVTLCHSRSRGLVDELRRAELVVAAVGQAELVRGEWIADGAVVIDVGMNRSADGRLCGDVEYAGASARARAITPVPGGVGPMTIAMLMDSTVRAAEARLRG